MKSGVEAIIGWIAQVNGEGGTLIDAYRGENLEALKRTALADEDIAGRVIFVPLLRDDDPDLISDNEYFEVVNAANDGNVVRVERMSSDELSGALQRYEKADGCPSRCYLVIYSGGVTQCECLAGASGRGTVRTCAMP